MNGKALALGAVVGLGLLAAGGSRSRSGGGGPGSGEAAARRALAATDAEARRPGFISPTDPRAAILTGEPNVRAAGVEVGAVQRPARKNLNQARRMAGGLTKALRAAEPGPFARDDVRDFQAAAGLDASGLYDDTTRAMLARLGIKNPPAAWFTAA